MHLLQISFGVILAALVAYAAYRAHALNRSGALAAFTLGVVVFGLGGLDWAVVLLTFFITSSGLSRFFKRRKEKVEDRFAKGGRRDAWQVAANGGVAGLAVLLHLVFPESVYPWVMFAAAFAAANADTWATELGVLNKTWPRKMTTWAPVPPGTSGGISLAGTLAAAGGSLLIAAVAVILWPDASTIASDRWLYGVIILAAGVGGSLVDSLLGATVQAIYWCPACEKETEKSPNHICGNHTMKIRGWVWMNNDRGQPGLHFERCAARASAFDRCCLKRTLQICNKGSCIVHRCIILLEQNSKGKVSLNSFGLKVVNSGEGKCSFATIRKIEILKARVWLNLR